MGSLLLQTSLEAGFATIYFSVTIWTSRKQRSQWWRLAETEDLVSSTPWSARMRALNFFVSVGCTTPRHRGCFRPPHWLDIWFGSRPFLVCLSDAGITQYFLGMESWFQLKMVDLFLLTTGRCSYAPLLFLTTRFCCPYVKQIDLWPILFGFSKFRNCASFKANGCGQDKTKKECAISVINYLAIWWRGRLAWHRDFCDRGMFSYT